MKKKFLGFVMFAVMLLGLSQTAFAADSQVTYLGNNKFESSFADDGFLNTFSHLMPGETRSENIVIANQSAKTVNYYMSTEVVKAFEDIEGIAGGGAYSVRMSITKDGEERMIYGKGNNGAVIGADENGLNNMDYSLNDDIMVATLGQGEEATITFSIAFEGESLTNDYNAAQREFSEVAGQIDFEFYVLETDFNTASKEGLNLNLVQSILTGDNAPVLALFGLLAAAAAVIVVCVAVKGRRKNEQSSTK